MLTAPVGIYCQAGERSKELVELIGFLQRYVFDEVIIQKI